MSVFSWPRAVSWLGLGFLCMACLSTWAEENKNANTVEAIRKALDQPITVDFGGTSLEDVIQHLREKTKIHFVLDQIAAQSGDVMVNPNPNAANVVLKSNGKKVRQALQQVLNPYNLTYVILGDSVLITTDELAVQRQMRQRVTVNVDEVALNKALRELARTHGVSLIIDPRVAKEAQGKVSLQLEDTTLETGVRLLAEFGGLKAVRVGNVLLVTTEEKAEKLRREEMANMGRDGLPVPLIDRVMPGGGGPAPPGVVLPQPPPPPEKK